MRQHAFFFTKIQILILTSNSTLFHLFYDDVITSVQTIVFAGARSYASQLSPVQLIKISTAYGSGPYIPNIYVCILCPQAHR